VTNNVYKKLQTCRVDLKKLPIKESGENKFAGYRYMELGDFLPHIVDLCDTNGLCTVVSFDDKATLTVVNSDKPEERIVFTSPMSTAELKGCHAIQNLGAVETYLRRYLYVAAFDIVEHDALDSTHGKDQGDTGKKSAPLKQHANPANKPVGTETEMPAVNKTLHDELAAYCAGDVEKMDTLLKRISHYEADGKEYSFGLDRLAKTSEKWVGKVLVTLKKHIATESAAAIPELCSECHTPMVNGKCPVCRF
jgi:hypothetical protein